MAALHKEGIRTVHPGERAVHPEDTTKKKKKKKGKKNVMNIPGVAFYNRCPSQLSVALV